MSISLRRACFGTRRLPSPFVSPSHHLRTGQYSNHLFAFKSSIHKPQQHHQPRYFPSEGEQQQQRDQQQTEQQVWAKLRRQEKQKSGLLWAIVAANTAVFAAWQYDKFPKNLYHNPTTREIHRWMNFMADNFILSVANIKKGYWWTTITSEFSHKHLIHFGFNMMTFVSFGQLLVHAMPHVNLLTFGGLCLGSLLSASGAALWHSEATGDPRGHLGASGMVSGVLAAMTCAFPTMPIKVLGFIPAQMWMNTLAFFAIDAGIVGSGIWSPIGHDAHVGGSLFGVLFYVLAMRRGRLPRRM